MLVLHDNPRALNAQKVRFLLAELELPYERRTVELAAPRPDWHLAVNPAGGVPALLDEGLAIGESNAILRYLAARERRDDLYPTDPRQRACVDWLIDAIGDDLRLATVELSRAAWGLDPGRGLFALPSRPEDVPSVFAANRPRLERTLVLLGDAPWACAGRFTLADVVAAPMLHRFLRAGLDLASWPRLRDWALAVCGRATWAPIALESGL